ncbi:MAG: hypothetical protein C0601_00695 [Candidatus Muiribacterium halophilum]|uniref:Adenylate/guanylate cyclase domain-containing protein n=1 Tax=Muiribacterium halophilum TaxID=2053465 RepID=A0A2N5ZMK0_MUIH1|nr:MAG: hypothetical protein C0601_00695 [Candidatus Muirbacterium halophilum]
MKRPLFLTLFLIMIVSLLIGKFAGDLLLRFGGFDPSLLRKFIQKQESTGLVFTGAEAVINKKTGKKDRFLVVFKEKNGKEIKKYFDSFDDKTITYMNSIEYRFRWLRYFFPLVLFFWLLPVYEYNSGKIKYSKKLEKRIINTHLFVFCLPWFIFFIETIVNLRIHLVYIDSSPITAIYDTIKYFLVASMVSSFINLTLGGSYINNKIALPIFEKESPYNLKNGLVFSITTRIKMVFAGLSIVPMIIIISLFFELNRDIFGKFLEGQKYFWIYSDYYMIFVGMIITAVMFSILQILSFRQIKGFLRFPVDDLLSKMKDVSEGRLDSKSVVVYPDEIGNIRANFNTMLDGLQDRERIINTFGKFVSEEVAKKLIESDTLDLAGEEMETTIMFTDLRNFTPFSENLSPTELIDFLNSYFSYMVDPILKNKGVINKFIGDAIMVIFSPIFGALEPEKAALKAALEMREALHRFNREKNFLEINHGIGIHSGPLVVGNVGTDQRMEFTVIGDTVNIAARIESQTKYLKTDILFSESVFNKINPKDFEGYGFTSHENISMKGKSEMFKLYSL